MLYYQCYNHYIGVIIGIGCCLVEIFTQECVVSVSEQPADLRRALYRTLLLDFNTVYWFDVSAP